jgi:hypothetical protein
MYSKFDVHVTVHRSHSEGKEPTRCDSDRLGPHPPSSAHSKQPSATQPRRLSRYGHLKAEDIY